MLAVMLAATVTVAQDATTTVVGKTTIPFSDAKPSFDALRPELWPADLRARTPADIEAAWPAWAAGHDAATRARIAHGDQDSIVHLLLFGTSFTARPRATDRDLANLARQPSVALQALRHRIDDFAASLASPGSNQRLQFARTVVERAGLSVGTANDRAALRRYLDARTVAVGGSVASSTLLDPAAAVADKLTLFRGRGLSSDTSLFIDFAIEEALTAVRAAGLVQPGGVRRVAIVGPGLDFTDKQQGYDFYAEQTIQPFAVIDSLLRLGLSSQADLQVTALDLSPRVLRHIDTAATEARRGRPYALVLPRSLERPWSPGLVQYWRRFGDRIGDALKPPATPPGAGRLAVRSVAVRPAVAATVTSGDLNVVLERLRFVSDADRFDLVVITNLLLYYDVFEQSLALENLAAMLRPAGVVLTNNRVVELPNAPLRSVGATNVTYMTLPGIGEAGDQIVWYQR